MDRLKMNKDRNSIKTMDRGKRLLKRAAMLAQKVKIKEQSAKCKQFSINVQRMDFAEWFKDHDEKKLEKKLENIFGDVTNTAEDSATVKSPEADNRLGRLQNGMVLLPRKFYNKHPIKQMVTTRRSSRKEITPLKEEKFKENTRKKKKNTDISEKNTEVTKINSIVTKSCPKNTETVLKSMISENINAKSEDVTDVKVITEEYEISLKKLSPLIKPEILPSKLWEIDRIPPIVIPKLDHSNIQEEEKMIEIFDGIKYSIPSEEKKEFNALNKDNNENINIKDESSKNIDMEISELCPVRGEGVSEGIDLNIHHETTPIDDIGKHQEEFPSIMDILNEKPVIESADDKRQPDISLCSMVDDDVEMETKVNDTGAKEVNSELPKTDESISEPLLNPDNILKTVVFKRYTENKESCDRLVTFHCNLEYSVVINDETIELLGAPGVIADIEDIKILLQIVDGISLDSFNIACKS